MTMSRSRAFTQVDVFSAIPYLGNPVAVIHDATDLTDEQMQRLARWTRVTYWLAPGQRVILLTVFRKTRSAESAEVARALQAQKICETEHGPAHRAFDREVN
jgi:hypothetical protein